MFVRFGLFHMTNLQVHQIWWKPQYLFRLVSVKLSVDKVATMSHFSLNSLASPFLFGLGNFFSHWWPSTKCSHDWHVQIYIGIQVILQGLIFRQNFAMWMVCGLSGVCINDRRISNDYVVVVIQEVFIIDVITIDPLDSNVEVILFWSSKFLKQDLIGNV